MRVLLRRSVIAACTCALVVIACEQGIAPQSGWRTNDSTAMRPSTANLCVGQGEIYGTVRGLNLALTDVFVTVAGQTQRAVGGGCQSWGWLGSNPPYDGPCTSPRGAEDHGTGGSEVHCLQPGRYELSSSVTGALDVDWVRFPHQSDGVFVNTDDGGSSADLSEVDVIVDSDTIPPENITINPVVEIKCSTNSNGPWDTCLGVHDCSGGACALGEAPGTWIRVGAWNSTSSYVGSQPLLRVNITGNQHNIKLGYAQAGNAGFPTARARQLPGDCYRVTAVLWQLRATAVVDLGTVSIGNECYIANIPAADTTSPSNTGGGGGGEGGGGEGGGGEGNQCPPNCQELRVPAQPAQPVAPRPRIRAASIIQR